MRFEKRPRVQKAYSKEEETESFPMRRMPKSDAVRQYDKCLLNVKRLTYEANFFRFKIFQISILVFDQIFQELIALNEALHSTFPDIVIAIFLEQ